MYVATYQIPGTSAITKRPAGKTRDEARAIKKRLTKMGFKPKVVDADGKAVR